MEVGVHRLQRPPPARPDRHRRADVTRLEERTTTHAGGRVRYLIGGDGPALVLCHGFLGSAENFEAWFEGLSRVRTLVIPDLPGCGASPPFRGVRHSATRLAGAVDSVCADVGVATFDVA